MASSSVASLPRRHDAEEQDAPAMLDRARGLASSVNTRGLSASSKMPMRAGPSSLGGIRRDNPSSNTNVDTGSFASPSAVSILSSSKSKPTHRHTHSGRISKSRLHTSGAPSPSTPPAAIPPLASKPPTDAASVAAAMKPMDHPVYPPPSSRSERSRSNRGTPSDMEAPVLSFWGPEPVPLPSRFARIKQNLIAGHEAALEASWVRLIAALRKEVSHIEGLGPHLIPSVEFSDLTDAAQTARFGHDLRRYGVGVVRKVVSRTDVDDVVQDTIRYLDERRRDINSGTNGTGNSKSSKVNASAPQQDPTCFDLFWTPAQVRSRAHPNVLRTQRFMMSLWETTPEDRLATRLPISYADRLRIHGPGYSSESNLPEPVATDDGSSSLNAASSDAQSNPQSADDWIQALQSSAGVIAQVDNGSLERWEPDGYGRAGTYQRVLHGHWEDHDPWECASRAVSTMDLYNGYGACTIFRMFQGLLALSTIEPGMVRLMPSPKLAAAYYMLRPFFAPKSPPPAPGPPRQGPEWDAYLAPENWVLQREPDAIIHGAVPGHAQRVTENWHPHLYLRSSMVTLPTLQPGDYIFWHPDLPYHISSNDSGLTTPRPDTSDVSMLVYIPAAPLTQTNALYLARQRKAFLRGHPGPDFDSGQTVIAEDSKRKPGERDVSEAGGPAGLRAMGLAPWEVAETRAGTRAGTPTPPSHAHKRRDAEDEEMADADADADTRYARGSSPASMSSTTIAEAEIVRLANLILFPDDSMV